MPAAEMNPDASKSSISLNKPTKSTPIVSTTPTNVNSSESYTMNMANGRHKSKSSSIGSSNSDSDSGNSNDDVASVQEPTEDGNGMEAGDVVQNEQQPSVMGSIFRNITGYGSNGKDIPSSPTKSTSLQNNNSVIKEDVENPNDELEDGIKFEIENGTEMLSYRKSRNKSNRISSDSSTIPNSTTTTTTTTTTHARSKSVNTPTTISSSTFKSDTTPTGITPVPIVPPRIDIDYTRFVDEKYLDTQYRYATEDRNQEFHQIFTNVPKNDRLLDDFVCALSREILLQGRLFISEHYLCFNSSLLGWVTTLVISLDEIQKLERRSTAGIFPNGIIVETKEAKHNFASFLTRDQTLNFIETIWSKSISLSKKNHEKSRQFESLESKTSFENMNGNSDVKILSEDDIYTIDDEDEEEEYESDDSEDDSEDDNGEISTGNEKNSTIIKNYEVIEGNDNDDVHDSDATHKESVSLNEKNIPDDGNLAKKKKTQPKQKFPGPKRHLPSNHVVDTGKTKEHLVLDKEYNIPVGLLYDIFFGKDITFHKQMMVMNDGLNFTDYSTFNGEGSERTFEYDKKLNYPIGPSSTRVYCTEKLNHLDFDDYIEILNISKTPNVPSGSAFDCRTKYTIQWGEENRTRLIISFKLEWSGSSWFKNVIESSALSGQTKAADDVNNELLKIVPKKIIEFNLHENEAEEHEQEIKSKPKSKVKKEKSSKKKKTGERKPVPSLQQPVIDDNFLSKQLVKTPFGNCSFAAVIYSLCFVIGFQFVLICWILKQNNDLGKIFEDMNKRIQ